MKNLCIGLLLITIATGCSVPTIFQPTPTPTLTPAPTLTPTPQPARIWISPATPNTLREGIKMEGRYEVVDSESNADLAVKPSGGTSGESSWIYTLVSPFNTVMDGIALEEVKRIWQGNPGQTFPGAPLLLSTDTLAAFESLWGKAAPDRVKVVNAGEITDALWQERGFGLIPFEQVDPRLKVLNVDGKSPLLTGFDPSSYPLRVDFIVTPETNGNENPVATVTLPQGNFDPGLLTSVLMTGTTALVRSTAERMESKGIDYPGLMIGLILQDADFTHISNEVSFTPVCPKPDPWFINLRFCSNPDYLTLLEQMGVEIVELTGNHLLDYNPDAFLGTLELYRQNGIKTFGGGSNLQDAREPLIIEHNGNRIAFLGCNPVGPDFVWATGTSPGAASCDFDTMTARIRELSAEGILVITTLQDQENYEYHAPGRSQTAHGYFVRCGFRYR